MFLMAMATSAEGGNAPPKAFPFSYDQHDYPNGLRLITAPNDFPNVVALYIVVATGSRNEVEPGKSGFAHLFEHMMFRGTKAYPPEKYEAVLKMAGAASNAYTSDDRTVYHTTFSKEDLDAIMKMEADRFQNLEYTEQQFKTEALAVLGEYNKNSAEPTEKLEETLRETAFVKHTYRHTTMGFLKDVQDMPNQFEYSKLFFDRYYRPEYTTIIVVGDVKTAAVKAMVEKYWGGWKRGGYKPQIPAEPEQEEERRAKVDWPSPTLPWVTVAYKAPAYTDTDKDTAALDVIAFLGFSQTSELYQRLVIKEQKVDAIYGLPSDHVDPYLFDVWARVKREGDMEAVEQAVLATFNGFKDTLAPADRLEEVKRHLRYRFALSLDNSDAIAGVLARYVGLRRTPETINRLYDWYAKLTPEDLRETARKYFTEKRRTVVTLRGTAAPGRAAR